MDTHVVERRGKLRSVALCARRCLLEHAHAPGLGQGVELQRHRLIAGGHAGVAHQVASTLHRRRGGYGSLRPLSILTGNGGLFLDFETERGADGAMTGYAFPELLVDVVRMQAAGQRDQAHDLFDAHLPLLRYEQQARIGLAVRKWVLTRRGLLASDAQRKPGPGIGARRRRRWST